MNIKKGSILIEVLLSIILTAFVYQVVHSLKMLDKLEIESQIKYEKRL